MEKGTVKVKLHDPRGGKITLGGAEISGTAGLVSVQDTPEVRRALSMGVLDKVAPEPAESPGPADPAPAAAPEPAAVKPVTKGSKKGS